MANYMPIEEMYRVTRGISKDWGMEHYDAPKKSLLYKRLQFSIPKAIRRTMSETRTRLDQTFPGPGKYEPDMRPTVPVHKPLLRAAKNSFVSTILKGPARPGPGAYFTVGKGGFLGEVDRSRKLKGPAIDKSEGHSFISEAQYLSHQSPGPGAYSLETKTAFNKAQTSAFRKPKIVKPTSVVVPGPGHYYHKDYTNYPKDSKAVIDPIRPRAPRPVMGKGNPPTAIEIHAKQTKQVPGVGAYKDYVTPLQSFLRDPKLIHFASSLSKAPRFPQSVSSLSFTKGPGHYSFEDDVDELKKLI